MIPKWLVEGSLPPRCSSLFITYSSSAIVACMPPRLPRVSMRDRSFQVLGPSSHQDHASRRYPHMPPRSLARLKPFHAPVKVIPLVLIDPTMPMLHPPGNPGTTREAHQHFDVTAPPARDHDATTVGQDHVNPPAPVPGHERRKSAINE